MIHTLPNISSRIFNTPLLIDAAKLQTILGVLARKAGIEIHGIQHGTAEVPFARPVRSPTDSNKISVIPVYGSLVYRTQGLAPESGLRSYEGIRRDFRAALEDSDTVGILFDIDSPGGEASGVFDLVDEIYQARGVKPIFAVANEMALSAAYAIASAADELYLPRTGWLGSIGVIAVHVDQSAFDAKLGIRYEPVMAGARKNDFSPHDRLSDDARAFLQSMVDDTYEIFTEMVARNRGMDVEAVRGTEAGIYYGVNAVQVGLADGVLTMEQVIQKLIRKGGERMGKMVNEEQVEVREEVVLADGDAVGGTVEEVGEQAPNLEEERERVTKIMKMCRRFQHLLPDGFDERLIAEGVPAGDAAERIVEALAEKSSKEDVFTAVGAVSVGETNILVADAQRRARERSTA